METRLDYKRDFLCVLAESEMEDGVLLKEWYPLHRAEEAEVHALLGRPVTKASSGNGIYLDEEGNVFQRAAEGGTGPIAVERSSIQHPKRGGSNAKASPGAAATADGLGQPGPHGDDVREGLRTERKRRARGDSRAAAETQARVGRQHKARTESTEFGRLNLREKFAEVRRRLGYVRKRGHNERHNYSYVTAADLAGAVGDILAQLGVVVIPQLQSISTETPPVRPSASRGSS